MLSKHRSLFVILTVCVLVIGLAAWKFAASSKAEAPHLERYLPASTIGFIQVYNLRAQTLNIAESDAWKEYSKTNPTATSLLLMGANHAGLLDASYAIALTGVNTVNGKPDPGFALIGEATDGDSRDTFRRLLGLITQNNKGTSTATTEQYGSTTIKVFGQGDGDAMAYAITNDLIIVSNHSDVIKSILDAHDGKTKSLADNPQLTQVRTQIGYNDGMFGFVDGVAISNLIDSLPLPAQKPVAMFRELFHATGADSAQSVAMTSSFANGRVVERYTIFAKDGGHGAFHTVLTNPGTRQDLLNLVPDSATMVADASIANAAQTFDQLAAVGNQLATENGQPSADDFFQQVLSKTGVDVRNDFIQSLGSEACIAHVSLNGKDDGIAIVNLADQGKFSHVIEQLAQRDNKTITTQDYQGTQIKAVLGEKGHGIYYAFINNDYVGSNDLAAVQLVIDTTKNGKSLSASDAYRGAAAQISGNPQFVVFGSNRNYLTHLGHMLSAQNTAITPTDQQSNLPPSFAYGVGKQDGLYVESYSPLGTFPALLTMVTSRVMTAPSNHNGE